MKHPLIVGHFDQQYAPGTLQVTKPLSFGELRTFLLQACDRRSDDTPWLVNDLEEDVTSAPTPICRLGGEDVLLKNGCLICPWLTIGFNKKSLTLISRRYQELGCQIYEPGDGTSYTPEQLLSLEEEFYRLPPARSS
jgi:hypothetical protein